MKNFVEAKTVKNWISDNKELAFIDLRELLLKLHIRLDGINIQVLMGFVSPWIGLEHRHPGANV